MRPLTLDDLLPFRDYAARRRECFETHSRYLDRYRRIRVGPCATLLFENRQTLWFRVQEIVRIARLADAPQIQEELDLYNRLLPGRNQLQAALVLSAESLSEPAPVDWVHLDGESVRMSMGDRLLPAHLVTSRPEDRCAGTSHWLQFTLTPSGRQALADFRRPARFEIDHASYRHQSPPLSEDVRQSLLDDLALSDRDGELMTKRAGD